MTRSLTAYRDKPFVVLYVLFFFSGVAALIYQLMWQRMLFTIYGVDLESITIVVSVFMLGLGTGGLIGGYIADKFASKLLLIYLLIEVAIALFGFFSPLFFAEITAIPFVQSNRWLTFIMSYAILLYPTALMGATFPVLVRHTAKLSSNVGYLVGELYFSNTIGGAVGAALAGFILLHFLDLHAVIYTAAFTNLAIAFVAVLAFARNR